MSTPWTTNERLTIMWIAGFFLGVAANNLIRFLYAAIKNYLAKGGQ